MASPEITPEELARRAEIVRAVKADMDNGAGCPEACKAQKITRNQYYLWRNQLLVKEAQAVKAKRPAKKTYKKVDLTQAPQAAPDEDILVVVGKPAGVSKALDRFFNRN